MYYDSTSKIVFGGICVYAGYICINKYLNQKSEPQNRKNRRNLASASIDKQIDNRNKVFAQQLKANTDLPRRSKANYERRRRPVNNYYQNFFSKLFKIAHT